MVTNNNLVVTYEIWVHGQPITTYSYERSFTRSQNMWVTDDETHGLGKEGLEWLRGTVGTFTAAAATDSKLGELKREFELYFGQQ